MLADARDPQHDEVVALRRKHAENGILATADYVLDETFTRLCGGSPFAEAERFCSAVLRAGEAGMVRVEAINRGALCAGIRDVLTADAQFATVQLGFRTLP